MGANILPDEMSFGGLRPLRVTSDAGVIRIDFESPSSGQDNPLPSLGRIGTIEMVVHLKPEDDQSEALEEIRRLTQPRYMYQGRVSIVEVTCYACKRVRGYDVSVHIASVSRNELALMRAHAAQTEFVVDIIPVYSEKSSDVGVCLARRYTHSEADILLAIKRLLLCLRIEESRSDPQSWIRRGNLNPFGPVSNKCHPTLVVGEHGAKREYCARLALDVDGEVHLTG